MNVVNLIGNLGKEPEIKYFESGSVVCNINIAVEKYNTNTKANVTHWIECRAWGKTAENIGEYFKQGHKIGITGELLTETWQDADGKNRKKMYVLVNRFDFLQGKKDGESKPAAKTSSEEGIVKFGEVEYSDLGISDEEIPF